MDKQEVGRLGEDLAAQALGKLGWELLERNWRCAVGEIDIVAVDGGELVVVEVKARQSAAFGTPAEAVTARKLARLRRLAAAYLAAHDRRFPGVRVDVIAVELPAGAAPRLEHLRGVG